MKTGRQPRACAPGPPAVSENRCRTRIHTAVPAYSAGARQRIILGEIRGAGGFAARRSSPIEPTASSPSRRRWNGKQCRVHGVHSGNRLDRCAPSTTGFQACISAGPQWPTPGADLGQGRGTTADVICRSSSISASELPCLAVPAPWMVLHQRSLGRTTASAHRRSSPWSGRTDFR